MNAGLIGTTDTIINNLMEPAFKTFHFNIFILNEKNSNNIVKKYVEEHHLNMKIYRNINEFLKDSQNIIIDLNNKRYLINIIKKWSLFNQEGTIIFRRVIRLGFGNLISNWFRKKGKSIDVLIFPYISHFPLKIDNINYLLLGGNFSSPSKTKYFRKELVSNNVPLLILNTKQVEFLYFSSQLLVIHNNLFLKELGVLAKKEKIDIEVIKRALLQFGDLSHYVVGGNREDINEHLNLLGGKQYKSKLLDIIAEINNYDAYWIIRKLKWIIKRSPIKNIAIYGEVSVELIKKIVRLPIKKINIYSKYNNQYLLARGINYIDDIYQTVMDTDVVIILSYNDEIASLSLNKLNKVVSNRIMIDQVNIFDLEEIKEFQWFYLSNGRENVYNI